MSDLPTITLYAKNDQILRVVGLLNQAVVSPITFLNGATVTATLYDSCGKKVVGATGLSMNYESGTDGNYSCQISGAVFSPEPGPRYYLALDSDEGGLVGHWEIPVVIMERRAQ